MTSPIITAKDLVELIKAEKDIVLIDASNEHDAKLRFSEKHLHNAIFIDINTELAAIPTDFANGGRHPLPSVANFTKMLGEKGINNDTHIVIYDYKNGANAAARLWWMLTAIGHKRVQVLDGGFAQAESAGFKISNEEKAISATNYTAIKVWQLPTITLSQLEEDIKTAKNIIIDVREKQRFDGEFEPIDTIAGHIPGAINVPFNENLTADGVFKTPTELNTLYKNVLKSEDTTNVVVHCGSGVTACHTLLAMAYAGFDLPNLYVGSWSEWSRNNKPIAKNFEL